MHKIKRAHIYAEKVCETFSEQNGSIFVYKTFEILKSRQLKHHQF